MKKALFLLLSLCVLCIFALVDPSSTKANEIYKANLTGTPGTNWNDPQFTLRNGYLPAIYSQEGIMGGGTINTPSVYDAILNSSSTVVKWTLRYNSPPTFNISCRTNRQNGYETAAVFTADGFVNIDWFNNGGGSAASPVHIASNGTHFYELDCTGFNETLKQDGLTLVSATTNWDGTSASGAQTTSMVVVLVDTSTTLKSLEICDHSGCSSGSISSLPVPVIKQYDQPAGLDIYDSANIWRPNAPYITNWGCAITSATMVLQYYGITTMPDDTPLTPGTLNTWLKTQPDGYLSSAEGNGILNWAAISRLTYIAKLAQNNPHLQVDALEYKRVNSTNFNVLNSDLQNSQPDILEEPNHFIVATGINGTTYTINDPYFNRNTLDDGYNNTFSELIRYVPSHTDISYIEIVTDPNINITLKDTLGNSRGNAYIQNPLEDDVNSGEFSGDPINIFEYQQPDNGIYNLAISGIPGQSYSAKVYFYDESGNVKVEQVSGKLKSSSDTYSISFSKTNTSTDTVTGGKSVTFFSSDLELLFQNKFIDSGSYQSLSSLYDNVGKNMNNPLLAKNLLGTELNLLRAKRDHGVTELAFTILQADIQFLLNHL